MKYCRKNIADMEGYVPGEQPRMQRLVKLNTNENPYPPSPALVRALADFDAERLRFYPDPMCTALREKAGEIFGFTADWVLAGNGSDDLLTMAVRAYVDQGGSLASMDPSYSLYPILGEIQGAECRLVQLREDFSMPSSEVVLQAIEGCSLFLLAHPNAPTGLSCPPQIVHDICEKFAGVVLIDEAYADFSSYNFMELVRKFPNVIVTRTFSKSYSLAGLRLGLAFANPQRIKELFKVKDSYNVNMLTQTLALAALADQDYLREITAKVVAERRRLLREFSNLGMQSLDSQSNFIMTRPSKSAAEVVRELRERTIIVRYFPSPRLRDFMRITIGTPQQNDQLLEALAQILA